MLSRARCDISHRKTCFFNNSVQQYRIQWMQCSKTPREIAAPDKTCEKTLGKIATQGLLQPLRVELGRGKAESGQAGPRPKKS